MLTTTTIYLTKEERYKCLDFGKEVSKTTKNYYNRKDVAFDHAVGKMAEVAVYNLYSKKHHSLCLSRPDFSVYTNGKSFAADLTCPIAKLKIHVKAQTKKREYDYGTSWTFATNDPCIITPSKNEYLVGVVMDRLINTVYGPIATVYSAIPIATVIPRLRNPILKDYDMKKFVYAEDF